MEKEDILVLVEKAKAGDESAFSEIYEEFSSRIYKFIQTRSFGLGEAEDLLQETFLKVWGGLKTLKTEELNFSAWVYKVATNTINDFYRKKYREPQMVSTELVQDIESGENSGKLTDLGIDKKLIGKALDELPTNYKQVIELRFLQEFSIIETAEILGKNSVTVRVWQHRAIKELEKIFQKYERPA